MKRDEILTRFYDLEFCEPNEKAQARQELDAALEALVKESGKPLYVLHPALLKVYPKYRASRLAKELPNIPTRQGEMI